ncbi:MAG: AAA family ATPase [Deltaproteobacteria bacterium]|jgi:cellulose biosynthesis protein BcsQ|nr:AAA family ATPase [Deltaproteobacteria bacterium]
MKVLIIDRTIEGQAEYIKKIEAFNRSDIEVLDLRPKLALERDYQSKIRDSEVVILGAGLKEAALNIVRTIRAEAPWLYVVMYVAPEVYSSSAVRVAYDAGVKKVLSTTSSYVELLHELVAVNADFKKDGRAKEGKVICLTHAKGGVGATSIAAGLSEVCSIYQRRTLLWDLDVETKDLCRSLSVGGAEAKIVNEWVNGSREITRDSLNDALVPVSNKVSVLMPPDGLAEAMDLVCHTDGVAICQHIVDIAKIQHDVVLIDTGGKIGPATGTLMRAADEVLVVIDDTVLGLTALDLFINYLKFLVLSPDRLSFLVNGYSGLLLGVPQIEAELEPMHHLGPRPWRLPPVPVDTTASNWPGSGKTLYSAGQKAIRATFEQVAMELSLIPANGEFFDTSGSQGNWWNKLLTTGN